MCRPRASRHAAGASLALTLGLGFLGGCASNGAACARGATEPRTGNLVTPDGVYRPAPWTEEELSKDVALRTVRQTDSASYHLVRIAKSEKPHAHDRSDLSVVVLSGALRMHVAGQATPASPGDVIDVPRGVVHWAENVGPGPSVAYIVFSPAFDGKDRRFVDEPHGP